MEKMIALFGWRDLRRSGEKSPTGLPVAMSGKTNRPDDFMVRGRELPLAEAKIFLDESGKIDDESGSFSILEITRF